MNSYDLQSQRNSSQYRYRNNKLLYLKICFSTIGEWPNDLLSIIKEVISKPIPTPAKQLFEFKINKESADHNWKVLSQFKNLGEALDAQKDSALGYGSEFRPSSDLERIFKFHPLWPRMKKTLESGVDFPLEPLSKELRKKDLKEAIEYGNHKGVEKHKKFFQQLMEKDVSHGYSLLIPLEKVIEIENALMSPMNVAEQNTISEFGEVIP